MRTITKVHATHLLFSLLGILAIGCTSVSSQTRSGDVTPAYEPRSFADVQPETVDLQLVPAPNLPGNARAENLALANNSSFRPSKAAS